MGALQPKIAKTLKPPFRGLKVRSFKVIDVDTP